MPTQHQAFWDDRDRDRDLQDRCFRVAYRRASLWIAAVDLAVNAARWLSQRPAHEG